MIDRLREDLKHLRAQEDAADLASRRLGCISRALDTELDRVRESHRDGATGTEVVHALTSRADELLWVLHEQACLDAGGHTETGYAILALGGYGRGALNPKSDIDLLFLCESVQEDDSVTKAVLHDLFDLHFEVGFSTRTIADCLSLARQDSESLTAMLEVRCLLGDSLLAARLEEQLQKQFGGRKSRGFVAKKREERRLRHARGGLSVQLLEPNVKESPGGLRDAHTVGWLLKIRRGAQAPEGLLANHLLSRRAYRHYLKAVDFLLRARNELHFTTGKRYDVLEHDLQPAIAHGLGYRDVGAELAVERFMRDYYAHARQVKHLSDLILDRLDGGISPARRAVNSILHRTLDDGAVLSRNHVGLPTRAGSFFKDDPSRLLSIFLGAMRLGVPLTEATHRAVAEHVHLIDDDYRDARKNARIFLDILRCRQGVAETLHTMHELGVLGAYVPEFQTLDCLVQYSRYHIYTADEHTLVALENLELLALRPADEAELTDKGSVGPPADASLKRLRQVLNELPRRHLLFIAVLMHDVGKSARGDDHSDVGARMARAFATRLGLPDDQIDAIVYLVRHHLAMSHLSQRRDLNDAKMLEEFARSFKHPDVLRMLYLITYADLSSVTRTAWTAWKGQLLGELYVKTFNILTGDGKPAPDRAAYREEARTILAVLEPEFGRQRVEEHLSNLPDMYAGTYATGEVSTHLQLIDLLEKSPVSVSVEAGGPFSDLTVCTRDKPYRLSEICGVLATNDINIIAAQAYTRADGVVIDVFQVTGIDGDPVVEPDRLTAIREHLTAVSRLESSVDELFARHRMRWSRRRRPAVRIPTQILFENEVSDRYSVIDIFAQDAVGLLYRITRALSDLGLDIYAARISTQADKAVDSFYVTQDGEKVLSTDARARFREAIVSRIEEA